MRRLMIRIQELLKQRKFRKRWSKVVRILGCIVVFCTVYALILPAITLEDKTYCGKEEHEHSDSCYAEGQLTCGIEEHVHETFCFVNPETENTTTNVSDQPMMMASSGSKSSGHKSYNIDLSTGQSDYGTGSFNSETGRYVINDGDSIVGFKLPKTLLSGQSIRVHVKGTWNGTSGFRFWVGNGLSSFADVVKVFANLPNGAFDESFELVAKADCDYLTLKNMPSWEGWGTIDGLIIDSIDVTYESAKLDLSTAAVSDNAINVELSEQNMAFKNNEVITQYVNSGVNVTLSRDSGGHGIAFYAMSDHKQNTLDISDYNVVFNISSEKDYSIVFAKAINVNASDYWASHGNTSNRSYINVTAGTNDYTFNDWSGDAQALFVQYNAGENTTENATFTINSIRLVKKKSIYNQETGCIELNEKQYGLSQIVFINLPRAVSDGETLNVNIKGSWKGTTGFRFWIGNGHNAGSNVAQFDSNSGIYDQNGNFNVNLNLTAAVNTYVTAGNHTVLTLKHLNTNTPYIDGLSISSIEVNYGEHTFNLNSSEVNVFAGTGKYNSETNNFEIDEQLKFDFELPSAIKADETVEVSLSGTWIGDTGLDCWAGDITEQRTNNQQILASEVDGGFPKDFNKTFTLTATTKSKYLSFTNINNKTIQGVEISDITVTYVERPLQKGLIAYFDFDGVADNTSEIYGSGAKATFINDNEPYDTDFYDNIDTGVQAWLQGSMYLDGTSWLNVTKEDGTPLLTGLDSMTISFYSKLDSDKSKESWAFYADPNTGEQVHQSGQYVGIKEMQSNNAVYAERNNGYFAYQNNYTQSEWHHVVVVYDEDSTTVYIDGEKGNSKEVGSFSDSLGEILGDNSIVQIGKANCTGEGFDKYFKGYIDEYKIYDYAMSEKEVKAMEPVKKRIAYFDFDDVSNGISGDGAIAILKDSSGIVKNNVAEDIVTSTDTWIQGSLRLDGTNWLDVKKDDGTSLLTDVREMTVSFYTMPDQNAAWTEHWAAYIAPNTNNADPNIKEYLGIRSYLEEANVERYDYPAPENRTNAKASGTGANWQHIVVVFGVDYTTVYVDGVQGERIPSTHSVSQLLKDNSILQIGKANWGDAGEYMKGYIDEYSVYNYALTREEILALKSTKECIAYFNFDYKSDDTGTYNEDDTISIVEGRLISNDAAQNAVAEVPSGEDPRITRVSSDAYLGNALYLDGNDSLNVTKSDGSSLLTDVREMTVSFYSRPIVNNVNYQHKGRDCWAFYAAPNANGQVWQQEKYIGIRSLTEETAPDNYSDVERHNNNGSRPELKAIAPYPVGKGWHHIVVVFENDQSTVYVDGVKGTTVASDYPIDDILGDNSIVQIGKANWFNPGDGYPNGEYFKGYLDEFKIFNYAMTYDEVLNLEPEAQRQKKRIIYYDFDNAPIGVIDGNSRISSSVFQSDGQYATYIGDNPSTNPWITNEDSYNGNSLKLFGNAGLQLKDSNGNNGLLDDLDEITVSYYSLLQIRELENRNDENISFYANTSDDLSKNGLNIRHKRDNDSSTTTLKVMRKSGKNRAEETEGLFDYRIDDNNPIWVHVVVVYGRDGIRTYVDGKEITQSSTDDSQYNSLRNIIGDNGVLRIGASSYMPYSYKGYIDEFAVYNYGMTEEEVKALDNRKSTEVVLDFYNSINGVMSNTPYKDICIDGNVTNSHENTVTSRVSYDWTVDKGEGGRLDVPVSFDVNGQTTITLPDNAALTSGFAIHDSDNTHTVTQEGAIYVKKLMGWYNIATGKYYDVTYGPVKIDISNNDFNVFYADWQAADYNYGPRNAKFTINSIKLVPKSGEGETINVGLSDNNVAFHSAEKINYNDSENKVDIELSYRYSGLGIAYYFNTDKSTVDLSQYNVVLNITSDKDYGMVFDAKTNIQNSDYWGNSSTNAAKSVYRSITSGTNEYTISFDNLDGEQTANTQALFIKYNTYFSKGTDTNSFITTNVFDYSVLAGIGSATAKQSGTSSELWNAQNNIEGHVLFVDNADIINGSYSGSLSYPRGQGGKNIYTGVKPYYGDDMPDNMLLNNLFNPETNLPGVYYVGQGNYLFTYDSNTHSYEYDSEKTGAVYSQDDQRFYVYDQPKTHNVLEGQNLTGFLPFNYYEDTLDFNNGSTNFWFGMTTELEFWLPDNSGSPNANMVKHSNGESAPMLFEFSGDDDVWVYVDDELVLDLGGIHQSLSGSINFSTGEVTVIGADVEGGQTVETKQFSAGTHTLKIYYMERGANRSNCKIKFNLTPRWEQEPPTVNTVSVEKEWENTGYYNDIELPVQLKYISNTMDETVEQVAEIKLSADNNWKYTWEGLDTDKEYFVTEDLSAMIGGSYDPDYFDYEITQESGSSYKYWTHVDKDKVLDDTEIIISNGKPSNGRLLGANLSQIYPVTIESGIVHSDGVVDDVKWIVEYSEERFYLKNKANNKYLRIDLDNDGAGSGISLVDSNSEATKFVMDTTMEGFSLYAPEQESIYLSANEEGIFCVAAKDTEGITGVHLCQQLDVSSHVYKYKIKNKYLPPVTIQKVDKYTQERLEGIQFALYRKDNYGQPLYYYYDEETNSVIWNLNIASNNIYTTNENGEIVFKKMEVGTYYLKEVAAPGYKVLDKDIEFIVENGAITSVDANCIAYFNFDDAENLESGLTGCGATATIKTADGMQQQPNIIATDENVYYRGSLYLDGSGTSWLDVKKNDGSSLLSGLDEFTVSFYGKLSGNVYENWGLYAASNGDVQDHDAGQFLAIKTIPYNGGAFAQQKDSINNDWVRGFIPDDKMYDWHHIVAVFSGDSIALYIDGVSSGTANCNSSLKDVLGNNSILQIGKANCTSTNNTFNNTYQGYIDEYSIYNYAMTEDEVKNMGTKLSFTVANEPTTTIMLKKVSEEDFDLGLSGAEFNLYGNDYYITDNEGNTVVNENATVISTLTSGDDGYMRTQYLIRGEYYLVETNSPVGYKLLNYPVKITVSGEGVTIDRPPDWRADKDYVISDNGVVTIRIPNKSSYKLPDSGSTGTLPYKIGGTLILSVGLIFGYCLRRKRERRGFT